MTTPMTINVDVDPAFERMADKDRRFRYVVLFCAFVLGLAALVTCGCTSPLSRPKPYDGHRDEVAQMRGTVLVETLCIGTPFTDRPAIFQPFGMSLGTGSGTVIDARHVLTANHVIQCDFAAIVRVTTFDGRHIMARIDRTDQARDVARVELAEPAALGLGPPVIGPVRVGDALCTSYAFPGHGQSCGVVKNVRNGDSGIAHDARTEHGNSGGGVWSSGRLVGVVTRLIPCDFADVWSTTPIPGCGGMATPLTGLHADWFSPEVSK